MSSIDYFGGGTAANAYSTELTPLGNAYTTTTTGTTTRYVPGDVTTTERIVNQETFGGWDPVVNANFGNAETITATANQGFGFFGDGGNNVVSSSDMPVIGNINNEAVVTATKQEITTTTNQIQYSPNEIINLYTPPQIDYNKYLMQGDNIQGGFRYFKTSPLCMIAAGAAVLGTLGSLILGIFLLKRDGGVIPWFYWLLALFGLLAALFIAYVLYDSSNAIDNNRDPNGTFVAIALILAIVLACLFIAAALFLFLYKPFHYANIASKNQDPTQWNAKFGNAVCPDVWKSSSSWLNWLPALSLLSGLGFLLTALCLWKMNRFQEQVGRWMLAAACLAGILFGLWALCQLYKARAMYSNPAMSCMNSSLINALIALVWIGILLLFLNLIWNLLKNRSGHFVFAILLIIYLFVIVCVLGLTLRDMRQRQANIFIDPQATVSGHGCTTSCSALLASVNENDIKSFCPSKYLPPGQTCTKNWVASKWETDGSPGFLNPGCCSQLTSYFFWPLYLAAALCLLLILFVLIAIAINFFLADKSEYLEFTDRKFNMIDLILAVIAFLAILGFLLYLFFRKPSGIPAINPNATNPISSIFGGFSTPDNTPADPNFQIVPLNKVYNGQIPISAITPFPSSNIDNNRQLEGTLSAIGATAENLAVGAANKVSSAASAVGNAASNLATGTVNTIGNAASSVGSAIKNIFSWGKSGVKNAAEAVSDTASDAVNAVTNSKIIANADTLVDTSDANRLDLLENVNLAQSKPAVIFNSTQEIAEQPTVLTALPAVTVEAPVAGVEAPLVVATAPIVDAAPAVLIQDQGLNQTKTGSPVLLQQIVDAQKAYAIPTMQIPQAVNGIPYYASSTAFPMYTANNIMTTKLNPTLCKEMKMCGFRFGVLAVNGRFVSFPYGTPGISPADPRSVFFNDTNAMNDFKAFCGTPEQLNALFANIKVIPFDVSAPVAVLFKGEQLNLDQIDGNCLRFGEKPSNVPLAMNGKTDANLNNFLIKGYASDRACYYNNTCISDLKCFENPQMIVCKKGFMFYPSDGVIKMTIPLTVMNNQQMTVPYDEQSIRSKSYFMYNGQKFYLKDVTIQNNMLTFIVPKPINGNVDVNLSLYDQANHYLPITQTYSIPPYSPSVYIAPDLLLLTKDGQGCSGAKDLSACWASKSTAFYPLSVQLKDANTGEAISGVPVKLYQGLDSTRFITQKNSDANGYANFTNSAVDYYTVRYDGSNQYNPSKLSFPFAREANGTYTLFSAPNGTQGGMLEQYVDNFGTGIDKDFCMSVVSHNGKECRVNSVNKYCAYSEYLNDIGANKQGFERIRVNNFTLSHYLTYLCNAPAFSGSCPALDNNCPYYPPQPVQQVVAQAQPMVVSAPMVVSESPAAVEIPAATAEALSVQATAPVVEIPTVQATAPVIEIPSVVSAASGESDAAVTIQRRALGFEWKNVRKLQTSLAYRTINCFNGFGFNTVRALRLDLLQEPSATICKPFYPDGSFWSLANLKALVFG